MANLDFLHTLESPLDTYQEGLEFFRGKGMVNQTLRRLADDLEKSGIEYSVIGAIALNQHGYKRFTEDIDLLFSAEELARFQTLLIGKGYRPAFNGATKKFRSTKENVPIEINVAGESLADSKLKPVRFHEPTENVTIIDSVKTVTLEKLVELKLASGISASDRLKDLADVQELIRLKSLDSDFAEKLDPYVRAKFLELHQGIVLAKAREEEPS